MKLTTEDLKKLDDLVRDIGKYLGMEFDEEYINLQERDWNYWAQLKNGNKRISFNAGDYKAVGRFIIRGEFPRDKRGQIHTPYNAEWPKITIAIDRGPEKIAKAIQSRLMPDYDRQLVIALEGVKKSDAYHAGRLSVLKTMADYFGQPIPEDDNAAIHPKMGMGIYKIEAVSEGVKFEVSCGVKEALKIFEILKCRENKEEGGL